MDIQTRIIEIIVMYHRFLLGTKAIMRLYARDCYKRTIDDSLYCTDT